jgi:hypothetical protein
VLDMTAPTVACRNCEKRSRFHDWTARTEGCEGCAAAPAKVRRARAPRHVAALFVRADSIYKQMPGVDAWDIERDARRWPGGAPVVAHPPCRAWGQLRHMAKPRDDEKDLARLAVRWVREFGGVLEHPARSTLWADQSLPAPGTVDAVGGWTLPILQSAWGHKADKATWLYIRGALPKDLPVIPLKLGAATHVIASSTARRHRGHPMFRPEVTKAEREHTPPALAEWLVDLARRCRVREAQPCA